MNFLWVLRLFYLQVLKLWWSTIVNKSRSEQYIFHNGVSSVSWSVRWSCNQKIVSVLVYSPCVFAYSKVLSLCMTSAFVSFTHMQTCQPFKCQNRKVFALKIVRFVFFLCFNISTASKSCRRLWFSLWKSSGKIVDFTENRTSWHLCTWYEYDIT